MESLGKIAKSSERVHKKPKANKYLHSPAHLLAEELSVKLNDKKHFGFYLKMAVTYDHNFLRKLMGEILENKNAQTPGKLFAYLIKKNNMEKKINEKEKKESNFENPPGWNSGAADQIQEGDVTFLGGVEVEDEPSDPQIV